MADYLDDSIDVLQDLEELLDYYNSLGLPKEEMLAVMEKDLEESKAKIQKYGKSKVPENEKQ